MKIKATILCENTVFGNTGAIAEHGWSVFIETPEGSFLFDTGQGLGLINNARVFKKDLTSVEGIILSHHHGDHTGGLLNALNVAGPKKVFSHPDLFKESYNLSQDTKRYIGIPFVQAALEGQGAQFVFNQDFRQLIPGMYLTGEVPRFTEFEMGDHRQVIYKDGKHVQDKLLDDQAVVFDSDKGLFIILGCAHGGIINTLKYAIEKTGQNRIDTVIGGTHLGMVSDNQRKRSIEALKEFNISKLGVSHCTGLKASMELAKEFGERFFFCNVGTVIGN